MRIIQTKNHDYSLQFTSLKEPINLFKEIEQHSGSPVNKIMKRLIDRLSSDYAHDDIQVTTLLFQDEVPALLQEFFKVKDKESNSWLAKFKKGR